MAATFLIGYAIGLKASLFAYGKYERHGQQIRQLQESANLGWKAINSEYSLFQGEYGDVSRRQGLADQELARLYTEVRRDERWIRRIQRQIQQQ